MPLGFSCPILKLGTKTGMALQYFFRAEDQKHLCVIATSFTSNIATKGSWVHSADFSRATKCTLNIDQCGIDFIPLSVTLL